MYITAASSISLQHSFRNPGFSVAARAISSDGVVQHPDYKDYIPAMQRRRMSDVLKMSIAASRECLSLAGIAEPDAIIVGTSMGCCVNIRTFLDKILEAEGGLISPTAFISSTHNTIAGQISMLLKNRNYNMTHTQNSLSFEQSLIDASLCHDDGMDHILVGGADEMELSLYNMEARLNSRDLIPGCGASFFLVSRSKMDQVTLKLDLVRSLSLVNDLGKELVSISNEISSGPDLILYTDIQNELTELLNKFFPEARTLDCLPYSGTYYTSSAFALHFASDMILNGNDETRRILILNHTIPGNLGVQFIEKVVES